METGDITAHPITMDAATHSGMIPAIMTITPVASSATEIIIITCQVTMTITRQDTGMVDDATIAIKEHPGAPFDLTIK